MAKSKSFVQLAIGGDRSYAVCSKGLLYGWGKNFLGSQSSNEPQVIPFPSKVSQVSQGLNHSAIIDEFGLVHTWGEGGGGFTGGGQLGHGSKKAEAAPR